jgi:hypothetical protein
MLLDDALLGEGLQTGRPTVFEASVELEIGDHPSQVDYVQNGGASAFKLLWRRGDEQRAFVPPANLVPVGQ